MAYKPLDDRLKDAFPGPESPAIGEQYVELLIANLRETLTALRRTLLLLILTGVAFLLLRNETGSEFDLGPFTIENVAPIVALLPAVTAYLLYEGTLLFAAAMRYAQILAAYFRTQHPSLYANDIELSIVPATASLSGGLPWREIRDSEPGWQAKALDGLDTVVTFALFAGGVGFLVYAYVHVFSSDADCVLKWISVGLAAFSVGRVGLLISDEESLQGR